MSSRDTSDTVRQPVFVKTAGVFCWWWPEEVVRSEQFNANNPPPKNAYVELLEWRYDGELITTAPHEVDFAATLVNDSGDTFRGTVKFKLFSRFEKTIYLSDSEIPPSDIADCEVCPWMDESVLLENNVIVKPNEELKVETKKYDLVGQLNEKKGPKYLCALRFVVEILDVSGKLIVSREKVIPVQLGD